MRVKLGLKNKDHKLEFAYKLNEMLRKEMKDAETLINQPKKDKPK